MSADPEFAFAGEPADAGLAGAGPAGGARPVADRAIGLRRPWWLALIGVAGFVAYVAGVIGGAAIQPSVLPAAEMGWLQQICGSLIVLLIGAMLPGRRDVMAWHRPVAHWLWPAIIIGLAITALGFGASLIMGDPPTAHGVEYFAYEATMPGVGEELGFRGLLLGTLLAVWGVPDRRGRTAMLLVLAALPFAGLHLLELTGLRLAVMFTFTCLAGVALGALRVRTGSLLPPIIAHNIANVTSGVIDLVLISHR